MITPHDNGGAAPLPAPQQPAKITTQGEALVLLSACGFRLDQIMGEIEFRRIQTRLQVMGLLKDDGEPTSLGDSVSKNFLENRKLVEVAKAKQPNPDKN